MHGIVSLLPQPYYKEVESIWNKLEKEIGLTGVRVTPYPHFSWQIAESYDMDKLINVFEDIAVCTKPFEVKTTGIGLFTGKSPVVFIPVVKDVQLLKFHYSIWERLKQVGEDISDYYSPQSWVPHISLAYEDVTKENIGKVLNKLSFMDFSWSFEVDNISFIYEPNGQIGEVKYRIDFKR
jgi:2'-5' RNA ligase